MRLVTTYLTMVLAGVALGRNIESNKAGKNDKAPFPSGVETLENLPVYYRNQMRQKFIASKIASNTAEYQKPIEIAPKKENVIPKAADAKEPEMVKQPPLDAQLAQKVYAVKMKDPEIKEKEKNKEPSKISELQTANDKMKAIPNLKETIMAPNSEDNAKIDAESKPLEVIKVAKDIPAISSPLEQYNANEKDNLIAEPQRHQEVNIKEDMKEVSVKIEKSKSKDKVKKEAKLKSAKTSEVKNNAEEHLDLKYSDDVPEKEIRKNHPKSSEEEGSLNVNEVDLRKNLEKAPKPTENLIKEKYSHKNKNKNYDKRRKEEHEDDEDDDSDDDDSSDGEDD